MNATEIVFDEDHCMDYVAISKQATPITLAVADWLEAADEDLRVDYKNKITNFVNSSEIWFPIAFDKIKQEIGNTDGLQLTMIYILFEQNQNDSLYGLSFNLDADEEHGRGMVLNGENFKIVEYGQASVSFRWRRAAGP
jgi:hypothetical protein